MTIEQTVQMPTFVPPTDSISYTGLRSSTDESEDGRTWDWHCPDDLCDHYYHRLYYYGKSVIAGTPQYGDFGAGPEWRWVLTTDSTSAETYTSGCVSSYATTNSTSSTAGILMPSPGPMTDEEPTHVRMESGTGDYMTKDLSQPYTDGMLYNNILGVMPGYSALWYDGPDIAYSVIPVGHVCGLSGEHWGGSPELGKLKYRLGIPAQSDPQTDYQLNWDEIEVILPDGIVKIIGHHSAVLSGTGSLTDPVYTGEFELMPPPFHDGGDWGISFAFVGNVSVSAVSHNHPIDPAVAGSGGLTDGRGCFSCGSSSPGIEGFSADFNLGATFLGSPGGKLSIWSALPSLGLATPAGLFAHTNSVGMEVILTNGQIRQVRGPQTLADVVTNNQFKYEIRFYLASQIGAPGGGGVYALSGTPFVTWRVENPDASTNTYNRLRLTEVRGSVSWTNDAVYTAASNSWKFTSPGGLFEREVVVADLGSNGTHQVTTMIRKPGAGDVFKSRRTYQMFAWGGTYNTGVGLIEETLNPNGDARTTTNTFYSYPFANWAPRLKTVTRPDGSWETYDYDSNARVSQIHRALLDLALGGTGDSRHSEYYYGDSASTYIYGSGDDGTLLPSVLRCQIDYLGSSVVGQRYTVIPAADVRIDIQSTTAGAYWNDASNLYTTNRYYASGPNQYRSKSIVHPDITLETFDYGDDPGGLYRTNMTASGQPNSGFTAVTDGTTNWSVFNLSGQPVVSVTRDIASGVIISQLTYTNFDEFGRPGRVIYLDGTVEDTAYACCGVDTTTDRDGAVTQYLRDAAKRQTAQTTLNITSTNLLDAAGRVLKTTRIGSDASQIVLSQAGYNPAGDMVAQTNALGGVTSFLILTNPATGSRVTMTTYPDGGTRMETNYLDGTLKQVGGTAVRGARYEYGVESSGATGDSADNGRAYTREILLNTDGTDSSEWTKTYMDVAGRAYKTIYATNSSSLVDCPYSKSWYNGKGQLSKQRDPDGVVTLYQYNARGELEYTAVSMNGDDVIDISGPDRVTRTTNDVVASYGTYVQRSRSYVYPTDTSSAALLTSMSETSTNGLCSWQTAYRDFNTPVVSQTRTVYPGGGNRYQTNTAPDGSYTVSFFSYGRLVSVTRKDSGNSQVSATTYAYDPHGRQSTMTDVRNGATTFAYNNADQVTSVTTPNPGTLGGSAETTLTYYDLMSRATNVVQSDGTVVYSRYALSGELTNISGSRTYPVEYTYDYAGRMKTMKTWQDFAGNSGTATTTWIYDAYRGWLAGKRYADNTGPDYTYTAAGRMNTRAWARGVTTTYSYNNAGDLSGVDYSDATPDVSYTYDRRGRQISITQGSLVAALTFNDAGQPLTESYTAGLLGGLIVTNGYDAYLRRTVLALSNQPITTVQYAYDNASRLQGVTNGNYNALYSYLANSPLVRQITFRSNSTTRMTTTKQYDLLNRLSSISSVPSASAAVGFDYTYNSANQRTRVNLADGSFWLYEYDSLGQVKSGKRYWPDWSPVAGQQFEYTFDDIGNRTSTRSGGNENGWNLRLANYGANSLNQYTNREVPGYVDIQGLSFATNTVAVNGQNAYRHGEYFRKELLVTNGSVALWTNIGVTATGQTSVTGNVFVARTPETYSYDADGNLTGDGRWTYTWDGENRLINLTSLSGAPTASKFKLDFGYDSKGRRIQKLVSTNNGMAYFPLYTNRFIYDGWNLLAELGPSGSPIRSFVWDLSMSVQEAGGVGGLLAVNDVSGATGGQFAAFDGNGNVAALVGGTNGTISAVYGYGPFAEVIRATGPIAKSSPYCFSTKYLDDETDLLYYGYRYYSPGMGRWLNRDPLEERTGPSIYGFLAGGPLNKSDFLGLCGGGDGETGTCGPDVTLPVDHTLDWINAYYGSLSLGQKFGSCNRLYSLWDNFFRSAYTWDIIYLANIGESRESGNCARTVMYKNRCAYAGALNYVMWGRVNKLCHGTFDFPLDFANQFNLANAVNTVIFWKLVKYRWSAEEIQAGNFTIYGYTGKHLPDGVPGCSANSTSVHKYAFNFRWLPYRNPDHKPD